MSEEASGLSLSNRLELLLDNLGVAAAHFCGRAPQDILSLLTVAPRRVASVTLVGANARPEGFETLGSRILWVTGDGGSIGTIMRPRLATTSAGQVCLLSGYDEFQWSDTVADRTGDIAAVLVPFLRAVDDASALRPVRLSSEGQVAEVSYVAEGSGTPVVLLPLGLAARQWDPLLRYLQESHCTIVLGGPHLAPVEHLESRGASDYSRMALGVLALAEPRSGDSLIEVGCGTGALLRRIARDHGIARIVGLDVNRFLLKEALALAQRDGLAERLSLHEGSAEAIPFPPSSFDIVFTSTVMEEVDADRMMAELVRIAKPGGRVAVVVRAVDRGSWTNVPAPAAIRQCIASPADAGGMNERGCADESLLRRMHEAGLANVRGGPSWAWTSPGDPWWTNIDAQIRGRLASEEADAWGRAVAAAQADGFPVSVARPFYCGVGTKR